MKKIISVIMGILIFSFLFILSLRCLPANTIDSETVLILIITVSSGMIASKVAEVIVDDHIVRFIPDSNHNLFLNRWIISLFPCSMSFYFAFKAFEYFANEPATEMLLAFMGIECAGIHLIYSNFFDRLTNTSIKDFIKDIDKSFEYVDINVEDF